jgi:hypothetical protein
MRLVIKNARCAEEILIRMLRYVLREIWWMPARCIAGRGE